MGMEDKARDKFQQSKGQGQQGFGGLSDDEEMEEEGRREQSQADRREKGQDVKEKVQDAKGRVEDWMKKKKNK